VRCDHALISGCEVSAFYDSMLAKVIAHAPTRTDAIHQLADALDRTVCLGLTTNRAFLASVLREPAFGCDDVNTAFLQRHFAGSGARKVQSPSWLRALAAASNAMLASAAPPALWAGWTSSNRVETIAPIRVDDDGEIEAWHLSGSPNDLTASCGDHRHVIKGLTRASRSIVHATVDGRPVNARCAHQGNESWWLCDGHEFAATDLRLSSTQGTANIAAGAMRAPMHGRVTQVHASTGGSVKAGELLLVMEAMKMEHQLQAPFAGVVTVLRARVGDQVSARQVLIEIEA
jgi:geranyl-CoA carboxylase alpha subunit